MNTPRFASSAVSALALLSLCSLAALSAGCSSSSSPSNAPPVVDALDVPATASIGPSGNYEVKGTLSAHDPDGVIHEIVLEIPGFTSPVLVVDRQTITSTPFAVQIDGRSPKGPLTANAKIIDDQGASASRAVTITLQ